MNKVNLKVMIPKGTSCDGCVFDRGWSAVDPYYSGSVCGLFGGDNDRGNKVRACRDMSIEDGKMISPNKPSWNDAPKWANWLCLDPDGWWAFYRDKPKQLETSFVIDWDNVDFDSLDDNYSSYFAREDIDFFLNQWKDSLEQREV